MEVGKEKEGGKEGPKNENDKMEIILNKKRDKAEEQNNLEKIDELIEQQVNNQEEGNQQEKKEEKDETKEDKAAKDKTAEEKTAKEKDEQQLKVILPPQNPVGPGEMGEAVQIRDPDPETKKKIGKKQTYTKTPLN